MSLVNKTGNAVVDGILKAGIEGTSEDEVAMAALAATPQESTVVAGSIDAKDNERKDVMPAAAVNAAPEELFHVFHCSIQSCKIHMQEKDSEGKLIFGAVRTLNIIGFKYVTKDEAEIEFLNHEIKMRHPYLSVVKGAETMTSVELDPNAAIKAAGVAEYLKRQEQIKAGTMDLGTSDQTSVIGTGTNKLVPGASSSSSS